MTMGWGRHGRHPYGDGPWDGLPPGLLPEDLPYGDDEAVASAWERLVGGWRCGTGDGWPDGDGSPGWEPDAATAPFRWEDSYDESARHDEAGQHDVPGRHDEAEGYDGIGRHDEAPGRDEVGRREQAGRHERRATGRIARRIGRRVARRVARRIGRRAGRRGDQRPGRADRQGRRHARVSGARGRRGVARRAWLVWVSAGSVLLAGGVALLGGGPLDAVFSANGETGRGDGGRGTAPGVSRTAARALSPETGDGPHGGTPGDGVLADGARQDVTGQRAAGQPEAGGRADVTGGEPAARSTVRQAPPPAAPWAHGASPRATSTSRPATRPTAPSAARTPATPSAARTPATRPSPGTGTDGAVPTTATPPPGGTATTGRTATEYFRTRWGSRDDAARHLTDIRTIGGYLRIYTDLPESAANSAAALTLCYRGLEYLRRTGAAHPVVFVQARFGENGNPVLANILGPADPTCRVTHPDPG
ncbi:hypothetical protein [Nonomuraea roseoviolacea]|uniref:Uncharacterized protein n=1 Tax=Nonomuraea roseoviolacea subsp. carminata TaxID=160689 RepID=A0ABT1K7J3_9ACTN|nr:hypothetical protein [Nonomuraea roseoviolacea]MCP2349953.1 hypothetical protein [Nonomuraea roseoviolacea subsp. carminata]